MEDAQDTIGEPVINHESEARSLFSSRLVVSFWAAAASFAIKTSCTSLNR